MKKIIYCSGYSYTNFNVITFFINYGIKDISYIVADDLTVSEYKTIPVISKSNFNNFIKDKKEEFLIIVFYNTLSQYISVMNDFSLLGLVEFKNYIQYNLFNKKIAVYWGNCHAQKTAEILEANIEFSKIYSFYRVQNLWLNKDKTINYNMLKNCDLIIYQDIRENNSIGPFASSENMKQYLNKDCKMINIPNLYGFSTFMYPQTDKDVHEAVKSAFYIDNCWWLWYRDRFIDEYIEKNPNYEAEKLIEYLKTMELDANYIDEQLERFYKKLDRVENQCMVKIKDYIKEKMRTVRLFLDVEHPNLCMFYEYARQICQILGINDFEFNKAGYELYGHSIPIYPQVKKYLNLAFDEIDSKKYKTKESLLNTPIDFDEYVRQYCKIYEYYKNVNNNVNKLN